MSAIPVAKNAYWTAMDAYLESFPFDAEPADLVQSLRSSQQDGLPVGLIVHPAFAAIEPSQLADRIESHAKTVSEHLLDIAGETAFVTTIDTLCTARNPHE